MDWFVTCAPWATRSIAVLSSPLMLARWRGVSPCALRLSTLGSCFLWEGRVRGFGERGDSSAVDLSNKLSCCLSVRADFTAWAERLLWCVTWWKGSPPLRRRRVCLSRGLSQTSLKTCPPPDWRCLRCGQIRPFGLNLVVKDLGFVAYRLTDCSRDGFG